MEYIYVSLGFRGILLYWSNYTEYLCYVKAIFCFDELARMKRIVD